MSKHLIKLDTQTQRKLTREDFYESITYTIEFDPEKFIVKKL